MRCRTSEIQELITRLENKSSPFTSCDDLSSFVRLQYRAR